MNIVTIAVLFIISVIAIGIMATDINHNKQLLNEVEEKEEHIITYIQSYLKRTDISGTECSSMIDYIHKISKECIPYVKTILITKSNDKQLEYVIADIINVNFSIIIPYLYADFDIAYEDDYSEDDGADEEFSVSANASNLNQEQVDMAVLHEIQNFYKE